MKKFLVGNIKQKYVEKINNQCKQKKALKNFAGEFHAANNNSR